MAIAAKFGVIALVALALTALPGGDGDRVLEVIMTALTIVFMVVLGLLVTRLYLQFRGEIFGLGERWQTVLYGSIGLIALTFCASNRLFDAGGAGVIVWLGLLALASYGLYSVWMKYRAYE